MFLHPGYNLATKFNKIFHDRFLPREGFSTIIPTLPCFIKIRDSDVRTHVEFTQNYFTKYPEEGA